jgi:hypothetical protein
MGHLGRDFGGRLEDETAPSHSGVGHLQIGVIDQKLVVQEQIQIQKPWSPPLNSLPPHLSFGPTKYDKQGLRCQARVDQRDSVEKRLLTGRSSHRRRFNPAALADNRDVGVMAQPADCPVEDSLSFTQVGTETNES